MDPHGEKGEEQTYGSTSPKSSMRAWVSGEQGDLHLKSLKAGVTYLLSAPTTMLVMARTWRLLDYQQCHCRALSLPSLALVVLWSVCAMHPHQGTVKEMPSGDGVHAPWVLQETSHLTHQP